MFAMRHSRTWEPPAPSALIDRFRSKFLMTVFTLKPKRMKLHRKPSNRAYCYTELAVSSLAVAETIASTHCAYPQRDGQAE